MKLITLAKKLDFTTETEYFDYCVESYINGNFNQCKELFNDMSKADKKGLLSYIAENYPMSESHFYYWNLL